MKRKVVIYVTSSSFLWHRLLRRTLVRSVFMASNGASINFETSQHPFRGWGQIRLA